MKAVLGAGPERAPRARRGRPTPDRSGFDRTFRVELRDEAGAPRDLITLCAEWSNDPDVEFAQPNYRVEAHYVPNDPYFGSAAAWGQSEGDLWGLHAIDVESAWDFSMGEDVVVAVVDSGVDFRHPDLAENAWLNLGEDLNGDGQLDIDDVDGVDTDQNGYIDDFHGFNFSASIDRNGDGDYDDPGDVSVAEPIDLIGHGTHVAGTIGAVADNDIGIVGVAPRARIMGVRALGSSGGFTSDLVAGIVYAVENGASIINNSWGASTPLPSNPLVEAAVRFAHAADVVVIFSAGNRTDLPASMISPQNMSETITVAATNPEGDATFFSSLGQAVDLAAPGGGERDFNQLLHGGDNNILSLRAGTALMSDRLPTVVATDYHRNSGTSMSAPHVAGVAALIRSRRPSLANEAVRQLLRLDSTPVPVDSGLGYGRLDASSAVISTRDSEILLETPPGDRRARGILSLGGRARSATNASPPTLEIGSGIEPTQFTPFPISWNASNGRLDATVDTTMLPDGPTVARVRMSDGGDPLESTTHFEVDNIRFTSPSPLATAAGVVPIEFTTGGAPILALQLTLTDPLTGTTDTIMDIVNPSETSFSLPVDTRRLIDSQGQPALMPVFTLSVTYQAGGSTIVETATLAIDVDNAEISAPANGRLATTTDLSVAGHSATPFAIEVAHRTEWIRVATGAPGPFDRPIDIASAGLDTNRDNLLRIRLLGDVDADGSIREEEILDLVTIVVDSTMLPGWPQVGPVQSRRSQLGVGDLDGDGAAEVISLPAPGSSSEAFDGIAADIFAPSPSPIAGWRGDGSFLADLADATGETQPVLTRSVYPAFVDIDSDGDDDLLWNTFGRFYAFDIDGSEPAGFLPTTYNDGSWDDRLTGEHVEPSFKQLHLGTAATFESPTGAARLLHVFRRLDTEGPVERAIAFPLEMTEYQVTTFDETGAVAAEIDFGRTKVGFEPTRIAADFDRDGIVEVVVTRAVDGSPANARPDSVYLLDSTTLFPEAVFETEAGGIIKMGAADLDGDGDLELVALVEARQSEHPVYGFLEFTLPKTIHAYHHDGSTVAGFPYPIATLPDQPGVTSLVLGDLDLDGDAEILYTLNPGGNATNESIHALDLVGASVASMPGWPVDLGPYTTTARNLIVADIDGLRGPEVGFVAVDTIETPLGLETGQNRIEFATFLSADGSPALSGLRRYSPSSVVFGLQAALADVDGSGLIDLVMAAPVVQENDGLAHPEVEVHALPGPYRPAQVQWGQHFANGRRDSALADSDRDGLADPVDNCVSVASGIGSPDYQFDSDGDGIGNACDADYDQSGSVNSADFSVLFACLLNESPNLDPHCTHSDANGDGDVTTADFGPLIRSFGTTPGPSGLWCANPLGPPTPCAAD